MAGTEDFWSRDRTLWLKRASTGEEFFVVYWSNGMLDLNNYIRLCYILRDVNVKQVVQMDVNLLNLFYGLQHWAQLLLKKDVPIILSSGFRTPQTNSSIEGAARNSMHLYGKAGDCRMPGFPNTDLANMMSFFGMGGVGLYPTHVHGDTGLKRHWVAPLTTRQGSKT